MALTCATRNLRKRVQEVFVEQFNVFNLRDVADVGHYVER